MPALSTTDPTPDPDELAPEATSTALRGASDWVLRIVLPILVATLFIGVLIYERGTHDVDLRVIAPAEVAPGDPIPVRAFVLEGVGAAELPRVVPHPVSIDTRPMDLEHPAGTPLTPSPVAGVEGTLVPSSHVAEIDRIVHLWIRRRFGASSGRDRGGPFRSVVGSVVVVCVSHDPESKHRRCLHPTGLCWYPSCFGERRFGLPAIPDREHLNLEFATKTPFPTFSLHRASLQHEVGARARLVFQCSPQHHGGSPEEQKSRNEEYEDSEGR